MKRRFPTELRADIKKSKQRSKRQERGQAEFLAWLLSIPSLETLPDKERARLLTEANQTGFRAAASVDNMLWPILQHTHAIAYPLMKSLLDGKETSLQPLGERERTKLQLYPPIDRTLERWRNKDEEEEKLYPKTDRALEIRDTEYLHEEMLLFLWSLLRSHRVPFPFRHCPNCSTAVFFCFGARKYCSRECTSQVNEAARKGTRNEYMRDLMAKKRKRAKKKAHARTPVTRRRTATGKAVLS